MTQQLTTLVKDFKTAYGDWDGQKPSIQALILFQMLRQGSGGTTTTSSGGIASTVTIRGSTGQTVLTDAEGRMVVANVANLLGRLPGTLIDGRFPVNVVFPTNQQVTISNPTTDHAKEQSLTALLQRIPSSINNRLPVGVEFPNNQQVTVANQLQGFATQATLGNILTKLDNLSVTLPFPTVQRVFVDNLSTDAASENTLQDILNALPLPVDGKLPVSLDTTGFTRETTLQALLDKTPTLTGVQQQLTSILSRLPELEQGKLPVAMQAQTNITGFSTEATLAALLSKTPNLTDGRTPVVATIPSGINVNNPISGFSTEATLAALLAKTLAPVDGKLPVSLTFPSNQQVTVSNPTAPLDTSALAKDASITAILNRLPTLTEGKTPVALQFPTTQRVIVDNPTSATDVSLLARDVNLAAILSRLPNAIDLNPIAKEVTLGSILAKLPNLVNGKTPVDFPANQTVTVSNPTAATDVSALGKDSSLTAILNKLPTLANGKSLVDVAFPTNQTVTVSNPITGFSTEATLAQVLARIPTDISRAIAQGFRTEFTATSPLATALPVSNPNQGEPLLWTVARSKQLLGLDAWAMTFHGRRSTAFAAGFTDLCEFDLQTVGNNLRGPTLVGTQTLEIVSSSGNDSLTGTGIRTVEIIYLDENFALRTVSVTLGGTVAVQPQLNGVAIRPTCILRMQATSHGSNGGAVGTILLRIPVGGLLTANVPVDQISPGLNSSFSARTCVPEGYLGYVVDLSGVGITANHEMHLLATVAQSDKRLLDGVFSTLDFFTANAGTIPVKRDQIYYELPSRCRVRLSSRSSATTASASGGFTVVFVKKVA